jgi:cyclic beta-1,2-glucan synthetase
VEPRVFISLLAYDSVRILIWLDHMGLRVATLVNLSFLGMDRLDRRLARFLAPESTARCIPEGVKRFTTWAPLLIPFYIPRGADWDTAWSRCPAMLRTPDRRRSASQRFAAPCRSPARRAVPAGGRRPRHDRLAIARRLRARSAASRLPVLTMENAEYEVSIRGDGGGR